MYASPLRHGQTSRTQGALLAVVLVAAMAATGCSDSSPPSPSTSSSEVAPSSSAGTTASTSMTVTIKDFKFSPARITVAPGQKITVINQDSSPHTLTAEEGKEFDTGNLAKGKRATITAPRTKGEYAFLCSIHPSMTGTLTVR
ncbi:cupredoxin domain-containing protein [Streptomyces sp. H27-C3]|uniref:cupredoxin domain-containing protein n=1 Tax=Streptomyces sp. H27-C3 TaxID=3046305 RepID=UPI0024BACEED|nr:cupredoxin domain-containing protein [Streptomyces sp. H27-C3]MDJ0463836.1 cupredoxin domain-containing protein [Streptomyces sp. H27-C3]